MEKKVSVLFIISALMIILNVVLLFKYTGFVSETSSSQATINLFVETACGDGNCNNPETCSTCPADCGSCPVAPPSGGGGGGALVEKDFSVDTEIIKVMTRIGESFKISIRIKNLADIGQSFEVHVSPSLKGLVFLSEESFYLKGGEEKSIELTFVSGKETKLGVYTGRLEIKTSYKTKWIPIIYSIKSKMVLFDVSLDIPVEYKEIFPGEELLLQLTLFNLGEVGKTDVSIEYIIKDFEGNIITEQKDIVSVETQVSFSKTIKMPSTIKPGDYVAIAQVRYDTSFGSSSAIFHVVEKEKPEIKTIYSVVMIVVLTLVMIVLLLLIIISIMRSIRISRMFKSNKRIMKKIAGKLQK